MLHADIKRPGHLLPILALWLLLAMIVATLGCGEAEGELDQPCYDDGSCEADLQCRDGNCVEPEGALGQPCDSDQSCDDDLQCQQGICVQPAGGLDQPCYPNNSCDGDLECQEDICVSPTDPCSAEEPCEPASIDSFDFQIDDGPTESAQDLEVDEGATLRISWSTSNTTSCTALGDLSEWVGATIDTDGSLDISLGSTGGTVQLSCENSADGSTDETQPFQITVQQSEPLDCTGRRPDHWQKQTDCIYNDDTKDCGDYEDVFVGWPGTPNARQFFLREDHYAAMRFVPPADMSDTFQASISIEEPQFGIASTGTKIFTISKCPGDFDLNAITEEMGTQHCYFRQTMANSSFLFGGLNSPGTFRCKFEPPADGAPLYLNIVYTEDPEGTDPQDLEWSCGGDHRCANRFAISLVLE